MRGFDREAACLGGWRWALESAAVGLILFALVVFAAVGAGGLFAATVVCAWILMIVFFCVSRMRGTLDISLCSSRSGSRWRLVWARKVWGLSSHAEG